MNQDAPPIPESDSVEMPRPTVAPLVLAAGIALAAMGVATSLTFVAVGAAIAVFGLAHWIGHLLPGRGHWHEPLVAPSQRAQAAAPALGEVAKLRAGAPGYRLRLPVKVHPVSAGVKGGIVGGLVMPLPAILYGLLSGHGVWWPVNLLAGMVLPQAGDMSTAELEQFSPTLLVIGLLIHACVSLIVGLMYGVLMPTLPTIPKPLAWGALLMPLLWTGATFLALEQINPAARERIEWPWFVASQLVFGVMAAAVFMLLRERGAVRAGLLGGVAGGVLMALPAIGWSLAAGHGVWYPSNLLASLATRPDTPPTLAELQAFNSGWLITALVAHAALSLTFGLAFALVLPRVPTIPGPLAWGGLLLPLFWTCLSYALMGVVNPALRDHVDWPWFIVPQFVFGIVAAIVVVRSQEIYIQPAGPGPEHPHAEPLS